MLLIARVAKKGRENKMRRKGSCSLRRPFRRGMFYLGIRVRGMFHLKN